MSLFAAPWQFADETDNMTGTLDISQGVACTLGANNADGSAVTLLSALAHDVHWLLLAFTGSDTTAGVNPCKMVDILQDPAGSTSWASFIDDLIMIVRPPLENFRHMCGYAFPVYIKSGTSLGIQGRTAHSATRDINALCWAFGNPTRPDQWWCGSKVEPLGATPAGSRGTTITPASGAYSSWTNLGSTTSGRYGFIQPGYCGENTAASMQAACNNLLQIGYGSNKLPGSPTWFCSGDIDEAGAMDHHGMPCWCDIPQGTQMQVRMWSSLATPDPLEIALYGVY